MKTRSTPEERYGHETLFSSSYRDIWVEIILPKLEQDDTFNVDKRYKNIWHIAGTCKSARRFALAYLQKKYSKERLCWQEHYHSKEIDYQTDRKRNYDVLITRVDDSCSFFMFMIHGARYLSLLATMVIPAIGEASKDPRNKISAEGVAILVGITLALSLIITAHNYNEWHSHNNKVDKELDFPRKQREKAINRRLTLFPEPQRPSIVSTIKQNCIIL